VARLINRGRRTPERYSPLSRALHESPIGWTCTVCGELQRTWYPRIPEEAPEHEAGRLILCRVERCNTLYYAYIPPEWRRWAEVWRPYQALLDGLWSPGNGPEPARPDLDSRPAPIYPRIARRTMRAQFCYYMAGPSQEIAGYLERIEIVQTDQPWHGAREPIALIMIFWPESLDTQEALLDQLPDLREIHASTPFSPGDEIQIRGARRGMDPGNWWPLGARTETAEHRALASTATRSPTASEEPLEALEASPEDTGPEAGPVSVLEVPEPVSLPVLHSDAAAEVLAYLETLSPPPLRPEE
jgi:hypothetical protein